MSSPDPLAILSDLVRIKSETGAEDAATAYLRDYLGGLNAEVVFDDGVNIAAALDWGPGPSLLFIAHHDTVPLGDRANWTHDPLGAEIEDGRLYGRGAADDKGGLAAMLAAAARLSGAEGLGGRLVIASVREEISDLSQRGVLRLLDSGFWCDYGVVGEPSGNHVALGHRGRYVLKVRTRGRAAHASTPEKGANAISAMAAVIAALDALPLPEHAVLGRGTQAVTTIRGGAAQNVIPEETTIEVDRRPVIGETPGSVLDEVRSAIASARERLPSLEADVEMLSTLHPSLIDASERIVAASLDALRGVTGTAQPPGPMRDGHTDQEWLVNDAHIPTVILGPGSATNIHGPDEFVETDQVVAATAVYERLARALLARPA